MQEAQGIKKFVLKLITNKHNWDKFYIHNTII